MARESKRNRDISKFGTSDLLVDNLDHLQTLAPYKKDDKRNMMAYASVFADVINRAYASTIVEISNAADFVFAMEGRAKWDWIEDFHCVALPYSRMFLEYSNPSKMVGSHQLECGGSLWVPDQIGWEFHSQNTEPHGSDIIGNCISRFGSRVALMATVKVHLNHDGRIVSLPRFKLYGEIPSEHEDPFYGPSWYLIPAFLALTFMHCKNVSVRTLEPDKKVNRVRARDGRTPFFRHHVIDINPMRRTLETEGGLSTKGLRKALHICRGHFARYTEDRPLFGRTTGLVWRPAHVRGSCKEGVVSSSYRVKGPVE